MKIYKNPDVGHAKEVLKALKDNNGYCPCQLERTKDTKCMCKDFREQTTNGMCHCGLYVKQFDPDEQQ